MIHIRAGKSATQQDLINVPLLMSQYYTLIPNADIKEQRVAFGTSGHRGTSLNKSFNQNHILAIAQAVVDFRVKANIKGTLYLGMDTHALSQAAYISIIEVMAANLVVVKIHKNNNFTPTPVISRAVILANLNSDVKSDALIVTPSHNPPQDGGVKYNGIDGGPANEDVTNWLQDRANYYLQNNLDKVKRIPYALALNTGLVTEIDFIEQYTSNLDAVIDMDAIKKAKLHLGVDPLGGSGIDFWPAIKTKYDIDISVVNSVIDPTFSFMPLDKDGKIRMDCSSKFAMANLIKLQDSYDLGFGNDPDYDRHGIVCPKTGLMDPNHFLAVAIDYLLGHRPNWDNSVAIGKTVVSSAMIDKVVKSHKRELYEVPVGFKWFVNGLAEQTLAFAGEESAGASFLTRDGKTWCTDKDGFILALLAAEILAVTGKNPAQYYLELEQKHGKSFYKRVDIPISSEQKSKFAKLTSTNFQATNLAGQKVVSCITHCSGAKIGGIKVELENSWFAARPSGTEALYKIYAESFVSLEHLDMLVVAAKQALLETFTAI